MKVHELRGYPSLRALNAFHMLMMGLKMTPSYAREGYEDFYGRVKAMPESDQLKIVREAANLVKLEQEEVEALVSFVSDGNGVRYVRENLKNLGPAELIDIITAVCFEVAKMRIDLVTESEKKKLPNFSVDVLAIFAKHPTLLLEEALNLAFYEAVKTCSQRS